MGPLGSGPRYGTDRLGQYKTYEISQSIRAQRGRARSALYWRVRYYLQSLPNIEIVSSHKCFYIQNTTEK